LSPILTHVQEFKLVDVGGQRSERKKWINAFKDIQVVVYVFSLNDYDLLCYEDDKTNRLTESLTEFEKIVNSEWFQKAAIVLVMNKYDLFKEKIKKVPLSDFHKDYDGGEDYTKATTYIENLFKAKNNYDKDRIFSVPSQNTDRKAFVEVFGNITKIVSEYLNKKKKV